MASLTKSHARERIKGALDQIPELRLLTSSAEEFTKWKRSTRVAIEYAFGADSRQVKEFRSISYTPWILESELFKGAYESGLTAAKALLESMLDEIEEYWPDDSLRQPNSEAQEIPEQLVSNRVFVVHGRDGGSRNTVARFLETLGLKPVILQEQPNEGRTIIQKFEDHSGVGFAVVLCTPDDVGALSSEKDKLRPRPRQNVILELGFFWGRLGRKKVCALLEGEMDMPSDYGGVLYIPLDNSEGWKLTLARELRAAGMAIDMNLIV